MTAPASIVAGKQKQTATATMTSTAPLTLLLCGFVYAAATLPTGGVHRQVGAGNFRYTARLIGSKGAAYCTCSLGKKAMTSNRLMQKL